MKKNRIKKAKFITTMGYVFACIACSAAIAYLWTSETFFVKMGFEEHYPAGPVLFTVMSITIALVIGGLVQAFAFQDITDAKRQISLDRNNFYFSRSLRLFVEGEFERAMDFYSHVRVHQMRIFLNGVRVGIVTVPGRELKECEKSTYKFYEEVLNDYSK